MQWYLLQHIFKKKCKSLGLEQIQIVFVACWKIVKLRAYSRLKTFQFVFTCSNLTIETTEQDMNKIFKINNKDTRTTLDHPCWSTSSNLNMWLSAGLMHFHWSTISIKQSIIYRASFYGINQILVFLLKPITEKFFFSAGKRTQVLWSIKIIISNPKYLTNSY